MRLSRTAIAKLVTVMIFVAPLSLVSLFAQPAKQDANRTEPARSAENTHHSDFDYLLGDWEFTGKNQQYGAIHGFWSAVRLGDDGPILDEYRVVGDHGETYYVTRTLRAYNGHSDQWELVSTEGASGLQNVGTGRRDGAEVHIEQKFGAGTPSQSTLRIRYSNIQADRFSWSADRSTDGSKTWVTNFQQLDVKRIGPPRSVTLTKAQ